MQLGCLNREIFGNLSFKDQFYIEIKNAIREADALHSEFGNDPFISFDYDSRWDDMISLSEEMRKKLPTRNQSKQLTNEELINFIRLKELIAYFDGKQDMMLYKNLCPVCGNRITTQNHSIGGTREDPEPDAIYYRVGCEKCNYYLDDDTIYL